MDVLAYKQGLFDTREQAKRVMAGLVVAINGERFDKRVKKIDEATELVKGEKAQICHGAVLN